MSRFIFFSDGIGILHIWTCPSHHLPRTALRSGGLSTHVYEFTTRVRCTCHRFELTTNKKGQKINKCTFFKQCAWTSLSWVFGVPPSLILVYPTLSLSLHPVWEDGVEKKKKGHACVHICFFSCLYSQWCSLTFSWFNVYFCDSVSMVQFFSSPLAILPCAGTVVASRLLFANVCVTHSNCAM